jgi:hypothetical protein
VGLEEIIQLLLDSLKGMDLNAPAQRDLFHHDVSKQTFGQAIGAIIEKGLEIFADRFDCWRQMSQDDHFEMDRDPEFDADFELTDYLKLVRELFKKATESSWGVPSPSDGACSTRFRTRPQGLRTSS